MAKLPTSSQLAEEFMSGFNSKKSEVTAAMEALSPDVPDVTEKLTNLVTDLQKLNKSLHDASMYLPAYSVKVRQGEIRELEIALKAKEDELIPKKKFGFRPKPKSNVSEAKKETAKEDVPISAKINLKATEDSNSSYVTVENLSDTTISYENDKISKTDVLVRNLSNVVLHLLGSPSTLRISNVENCKIICGPVHTSVFVESAVDSVLFLCCQQLRTHSSKNTDIYLRVRSRAIIEECTGIRFGPYSWDHAESQTLHEMASIDFDLQRFDAVDDFNWLSASQSPNWSIIPEGERVSFPSL